MLLNRKKQLGLLLVIGSFFTGFAQHDYTKAQHLSTYFLGAQRSGDYQSWIHDASHTKDGQSLTSPTNLTGGWHDCGDYVKFSFTNNWAATMYLMGYHLFPEAYADDYSQAYSAPPSNNIPDILDEVKVQTDFAIRSYMDGIVALQVGSGDYDHNGSFAVPEVMSGEAVNKGGDPRPIYTTTACPNVLGSASASLALMYMSYKDLDQDYSDSCLAAAINYYNLGVGQTGSCGSVDCSSGGSPCYDLSSKSEEDEMCMAAICLYEATNEAQYLTEAENYYNASIWNGEIHYYGNMYVLATAQLYRLTNNATYLNKLKAHFTYHNQSQFSTLGFYKYQWSSGWGNLQYTGNEAFVAAIVHKLDPTETAAYTFVKNNVDFILGSHDGLGNIAANYSFLIGYDEMGGGYPQHPHHKAAFGSTVTNWANFTNESNNPGSVPYVHELKGAIVGGPNDDGDLVDAIDDFQTMEVCTYYNAGFTGAVAYVNKIENNLVTSTLAINSGDLPLIYPNPVDNILSFDKTIDTAKLLDALGNIVLKSTSAKQLDVSKIAPGVYILDLDGEQQKVVIE